MKRLLLGLILATAARVGLAQITFDTGLCTTRDSRTTGTAEGPVTVGSNNNRYMIGGFVARTTDGTGTPVLSGFSYNGTAMTQLGTLQTADQRSIWLWGLAAPATGSHNFDLTYTAGEAQDSAAFVAIFYNVAQTSSTGTFNSASGTSTAPTVNITSAVNEMVVDILGTGTTISSYGAGQTANFTACVSGNGVRGASSREAGASSVTMSETIGASVFWAIGGISLKPAISRRRGHANAENLFDWVRLGGLAMIGGRP